MPLNLPLHDICNINLLNITRGLSFHFTGIYLMHLSISKNIYCI